MFDAILNRHATYSVSEVVRLLRPGGLFVTQQVGPRNMRDILALLGWDQPDALEVTSLPADPDPFHALGLSVLRDDEYDVRYVANDVESLVFWLKALHLETPEPFDPGRHWRRFDSILQECSTPAGIETNEHRRLLVVRR